MPHPANATRSGRRPDRQAPKKRPHQCGRSPVCPVSPSAGRRLRRGVWICAGFALLLFPCRRIGSGRALLGAASGWRDIAAGGRGRRAASTRAARLAARCPIAVGLRKGGGRYEQGRCHKGNGKATHVSLRCWFRSRIQQGMPMKVAPPRRLFPNRQKGFLTRRYGTSGRQTPPPAEPDRSPDLTGKP